MEDEIIVIGKRLNTKTMPILVGVLLSVIVKSFFGNYEFLGLLIIGLLVGYLVHEDILDGIWDATVAGVLGTIVSFILFILIATFGETLGLFGGLFTFTGTGMLSLFAIIGNLIYYMIIMGIGGAIGGAISSK